MVALRDMLQHAWRAGGGGGQYCSVVGLVSVLRLTHVDVSKQPCGEQRVLSAATGRESCLNDVRYVP
jgi:hypothetical protein